MERKEYNRQYYIKNREKILSANKIWGKAHHDITNANKLNSWHSIVKREREKTFVALGDKCAKCGFADRRALQIDHVNGYGFKEKDKTNNRIQYLRRVFKSFTSGENRYQLLCANCNWVKRHENREHSGIGGKYAENIHPHSPKINIISTNTQC